MNALLLCAGRGLRLRPITDTMPKALVKIDGEPLIFRQIKMLEKIDELDTIVIPLFYLGKKIEDYIRNNIKTSKKLHIYNEKTLLGTAEKALIAIQDTNKKQPLIIIYVDTYFLNLNLFNYIATYYFQYAKPVLGISKKKYIPEKARGMVSFQNDLVKSFEEHPLNLKVDTYFQNAGVIILSPETYPLLKELKVEGEYSLGEHFLPEAVRKYPFKPYYTGDYIDIGDLDSYYELQNRIYKDKLQKCLEINFFELFKTLLETKGTIWLIGNGGSLAIAQHAALDLTKAAGKRAFAIGDAQLITAYSNDISFKNGIAHYLPAVWRHEDIVIALSTSGESENLISVIEMAKRDQLYTIGMTSKDSTLSRLVKLAIEFEEKDPKVLEDSFQIIFHKITRLIQDTK